MEAGDTSGQHILNYPHGLFSSREKESAVCPNSALTARRKLLVPLLGRITANSQEEKAVEHTPHPIGMNESHRARLANDADPPEPWRQSQGPKASPSPRSRPAPGVQLFRRAQGKSRAGGLWGASQKPGCWYNRLSPLWCRGTAGWGVFSKSGALNKALEYTWVSGEVGACSCCWSWEAVFCLAAGRSTLWLQPVLQLIPPGILGTGPGIKPPWISSLVTHMQNPPSFWWQPATPGFLYPTACLSLPQIQQVLIQVYSVQTRRLVPCHRSCFNQVVQHLRLTPALLNLQS